MKAFRNAEFVFSEKFTPVMLFEVLKSVVAELNSEYRGREIKVEMTRFMPTPLFLVQSEKQTRCAVTDEH